jgi:hypothetical protein
MQSTLFSNDCQFLLWNNRKIRVGQSSLVIPEGMLNNFDNMHKYSIEEDIILKHFVVLLGMNVIPKTELEYKQLMRRLRTLSITIDKYNSSIVYCIADYTDPDNWIAKQLDSDGILLDNNLICKNGIIS